MSLVLMKGNLSDLQRLALDADTNRKDKHNACLSQPQNIVCHLPHRLNLMFLVIDVEEMQMKERF